MYQCILQIRSTVRRLRRFAPLALSPSVLWAQSPTTAGGRSEVFVSSEVENYLRYLQTIGASGLYPWSVRSFSPREVDSLVPRGGAHPWAARYDLSPRRRRGIEVDVVRPTVSVRFNSAFPYGSNDGAVWAGRGLTTAAQAGVAVRWGPVSLTLAPMVFRADNAPFPLQPNGQSGRLAFADGAAPTTIDRPQRFGDGVYTAVDPGQSTLRFDGYGVTLGVSTANQGWGPGAAYPFLLGANAAGYPHAFVGTERPLDLWLFRLHARAVYGELAQSDYTNISGDERRRFMSGFVATVQPRGVPGLELGMGRFYHTPWPADGLTSAQFRKPFQGVTKSNVEQGPDSLVNFGGLDNQLASLFGRWVLPGSGFELYAEYGRDDHNWDTRDLTLEPDHAASVMAGFRKVWHRQGGRLTALRGELINFQRPPNVQRRPGGEIYVNSRARQGHTHQGQLLGADVGVASAAGSTVALDWYSPRGRWTVSWSRTLRQHTAEYVYAGTVNPRGMDVLHALGTEALLFAGSVDLTAGVTVVANFNRAYRSDAWNLNAVLGTRWGFPGW